MGLNGPDYNKHLRSDNIFGICSSFLSFLSSGIGASTSYFIGRSVGRYVSGSVDWSVGRWSVCQKKCQKLSKRSFAIVVQGDYKNILRCTFVLCQSLEALINEKQPILCSSLITSSICTNPFGTLNHTYPELSVARATLVRNTSSSKSCPC